MQENLFNEGVSCRAAVSAGHDRFINSGPVRSIVGGFDGGYQLAAGGAAELSGKSPPWCGVGLYQVSRNHTPLLYGYPATAYY